MVVSMVSKKDPCLKHVKIIQTFNQALDVSAFLEALLAGSNVKTVAFVGINLDEEYSAKLAKAISDSTSLIVWLPPTLSNISCGTTKVCPSLSRSKDLKELHLTFNHDLSLEGIRFLLMHSLGESCIEIFKLYCVDLHDKEATQLLVAKAIKLAKKRTDL